MLTQDLNYVNELEIAKNPSALAYFKISYQVYHQTSNISRTLVGIKIVDHSDVVGVSPVGTAQTTSSFST